MATANRPAFKALQALLVSVLLGAAAVASAEIVVIGNAGSPVTGLSEMQIKDIYLGKTANLPDGSPVEIVDLPSGDPVRDAFYEQVIGKDASQVKSYWAKRIFTGKGTPPATKPDAAAVVKWVAEAPGRIGYVDSGSAPGSVKVLFRK